VVSMQVLARFPVVRSADLDEMRCSISQFLTPHRLTPAGRTGGRVRTDVSATALGPLSLVYAWHRGAELDAHLTRQLDYYDVNVSLGGHNTIVVDGDETVVEPGFAGIISPRTRADMRLAEDYRQLHVRIEQFALERELERMTGRPVTAPVRFRVRMDLGRPAPASWLKAVRLLVSDLDEPRGLAGDPRGSAPWAGLVISGLLLAQPHNYSHLLGDAVPRPARPAPVRKAIDLIELDPAGDLSLARIARAAELSPRSLQRHFRTSVGVTPLEYVTRFRLTRAHEDLRRATPASGTVTEIALRWGFTHVPRFAGLYKQHYGVAPSATLRS
ncbi:MAG: AraC family transcriptional regulator, partial [Acidimicrobiales bacterium]